MRSLAAVLRITAATAERVKLWMVEALETSCQKCTLTPVFPTQRSRIMSSEKPTLGKAIDIIISALEPLDEVSRETALLAVGRQLGVSAGSVVLATGNSTSELQPDAPSESFRGTPIPQRIDIRTLKEQKQPNSAKQMACIVAYYLKELADEEERKDSVSTSDLEKYFKQAGFKLPQKMGQVLVDAKGSGYFESSGRGEYKLNAVGHNLVAHTLPSDK